MRKRVTRSRYGRSMTLLLALGVVMPLAGWAQITPDDFNIKTTPLSRRYASGILQFAREWQQTLCREMGLPDPQTYAPMEIELGNSKADGERIDHAVLRGRRGYFGLVRIPDPAEIARDDLCFALTAAMVRTTIYNLSTKRDKVTEPPVWFVRGIARHGDRNLRGLDFEDAYDLWSCARLPGVGELWHAQRSPAHNHLSVAAQLVAFCVSRQDRQERWLAWSRHLAAGGGWAPKKMAQIWNDDSDLAALDLIWDRWLLARTRRVFDIGSTSAGVMRRFRSLLLLYPWECDIYKVANFYSGIPLAHCLEESGNVLWRQAAVSKARQLGVQGAGRSPEFQVMADAYADVMLRLAEGAEAEELKRLWHQAERKRHIVETLVAEGGISPQPALEAGEKDFSGR